MPEGAVIDFDPRLPEGAVRALRPLLEAEAAVLLDGGEAEAHRALAGAVAEALGRPLMRLDLEALQGLPARTRDAQLNRLLQEAGRTRAVVLLEGAHVAPALALRAAERLGGHPLLVARPGNAALPPALSERVGGRVAFEGGDGSEPTFAFNFRVTIGDQDLSVARISGLELKVAPGSLARRPDARPPAPPFAAEPAPGALVLARAVDGSRLLYDWRREAQHGKPALRDIVIRQLSRDGGTAVNAWRVRQAWPVRWSGPVLDALSGGLAFEELECAFVDIDWL